MMATERFETLLQGYCERFAELAEGGDGSKAYRAALEQVLDAYAAFVTDGRLAAAWAMSERQGAESFGRLVADVRLVSAKCVAMMEKHRARGLLDGTDDTTGYFRNIESCIEEEFGSFRIGADSNVVLVGSGAFPMTPLLIAGRTGAEVTGIDIDEEAVELGRRVVERLGGGLRIRLEGKPLEQLDMARATHIIFSSTVPEKYELLDRLHARTSADVVAAVRFGDGLKSLFNYPMREVDPGKWQLAETVRRPAHVFDIALYRKA